MKIASAPHEPSSCLHDLIEASVRRNPDATALVDGTRPFSYSQLDARAEAVARRLRALGVGPGAVVGLAARRRAESIAGLIGVLKSGAAYCPLDPAYPPERLSFMLQDSGAAVLLTGREDAAKLADPGRPTVILEDLADHGPAGPASPSRAAGPGDPAYVIYTSGSTGRPKGVIVDHSSAVNFVRAMIKMAVIGPGERAFFFTSMSFDVSVGELFPALSSGATLFLREDKLLEAREFIENVEALRIDRLFLPTAYWHELAAVLGPRGKTLPYCLRSVIMAGEALRAESLDFWRPAAGRVRLINGYGPTEATVCASFHEIPADAPSAGIVPIGRPAAGAELHVVDSAGRPVADGGVGELWIGGPGVARGYLNRAELTARRFVPDPFSARPGARAYRSGDRVSRRPDGVLEYHGRFDDQVKIRGFRVELGEVESLLAAHPTVGTCAVVLREERPGVQRLAAYVSPSAGASVSVAGLRAYLLERAPDYMVPAVIVVLRSLPLTPAGKIDRRALPPPPPPERTSAGTDGGPWTPLERRIRDIWEEVLGVSPIGRRDDFFALGGHSLLAVRVMAKIERIAGRRPPLTALGQGATIESIARAMGEDSGTRERLVRFGPEQGADPIFFVHPGLGGLYCQEMSRAMPDRPVYVLAGLETAALDRIPTIEEIARRHVKTIRTVSPRGPYRLGGYSIGCTIAYEMARQLEAAGEPVRDLILVAAHVDGSGWGWRAVRRGVALVGRFLGHDQRTILDRFNHLGRSAQIVAGALKRKGAARLRAALRRRFARVKTEGSLRAFIPSAAEFDDTLKALLWAWADYRPGPYRGIVTLLEVEDPFLDRRASALSRLAPAARRVRLPGDHDTIVTTYAAELGAEIGRRLS